MSRSVCHAVVTVRRVEGAGQRHDRRPVDPTTKYVRRVDRGVAAEVDEVVGVAAVYVTTRDDALQPHLARGWGARVHAGEGCLDLVIATSDCPAVVADLESNGAMAVTFVVPTTYKALQVKGTLEHMGEPSLEDHERVQAHLQAFVEQCIAVGLSDAAAVFGTELLAARMRITSVYEQTPGAGAGRPL